MSKEISIRAQGPQGLKVYGADSWKEAMQVLPVKADTPPSQLVQIGSQQEISTLGKTPDGRMVGYVAMKDTIIDIVEFFGLTPAQKAFGAWTVEQITKCAEMAYAEAYWFTLAELKQWSLKVCWGSGKYTSQKNLSPPVLLSILDEYMAERLTERELHYGQKMSKDKLPPTELTEEQYQANMDRLKSIAMQVVAQMQDEEVKDKLPSTLHDEHRAKQYAAIQKLVDAGHTLDAKTKARYEQLKKYLNK